jgi:hypothetical protein
LEVENGVDLQLRASHSKTESWNLKYKQIGQILSQPRPCLHQGKVALAL